MSESMKTKRVQQQAVECGAAEDRALNLSWLDSCSSKQREPRRILLQHVFKRSEALILWLYKKVVSPEKYVLAHVHRRT
jgi:hypothetical protein